MNHSLIVSLLLSCFFCLPLLPGQKLISSDMFGAPHVLTLQQLREQRDQRAFENFRPHFTVTLEELREARDQRPLQQLRAHYAEKYNIPALELSYGKLCELHTKELQALINADIAKALKAINDK